MNSTYFYPEDGEQRNVIDRLANFVAKNGIDFELMTKQKQQGNPVFDFLFGGAYSDYYQYRLSEERMMIENENRMHHNASDYLENNTTSFPPSSNRYVHGFDFTQTEYFQNYNVVSDMNKRLEELKNSLANLQEDHYKKLTDSQQNLTAESVTINKEKIIKCLNTVNYYRLIKIKQNCIDHNINFELMESNIEALIVSCTKENICNGKNFVIENMQKDSKSSQIICEYLLARVSNSDIFNEKLHIIYFLNDLLHYCKRKTVSNLLEAIESVLVVIYSMCVMIADEEGKSKLNKVLSLWETNSYVRNEILNSMSHSNDNPALFLDNWQDNEINSMKREEDENIMNETSIPIDETISGIFSAAKMRLNNLEANHNQLKYELKIEEENIQLEIYQLERDIKMAETEIRRAIRDPPGHHQQEYPDNDYSVPLVPNYDMTFPMPDFTRPPPGFSMCDMPGSNSEPPFLPGLIQQPDQFDQIASRVPEQRPSIPYWRLPAAVMVAHIKLAQYDYVPIDANAIQLPQLRPPSKRLLDVTNTFYQPPSHEMPRDTEGWEKLALHEFYKMKEKAKNGDLPDDFVSSLHEKQNEQDFLDNGPMTINDRLVDTDYRNMGVDEMHDYRQGFNDYNSCPNNDFNYHQHHNQHHHSQNQYSNSGNFNPRINAASSSTTNPNQRSLLGGSPWEEYRHHHQHQQPFNNASDMVTMGTNRSNMNYSNANNRLAPSLLGGGPGTQRHGPPNVTPLMSLDIANSFKRGHHQHQYNQNPRSKPDSSYRRNNVSDSYNSNNRSRNRYRYNSRSRSPYDTNNSSNNNRSVSKSRSRSRSSRYSRSRSRTYSRSRSRSISRSRSKSSRSSSSDKRPYKGGFIARKSRSRSYSRSRSLSRSPKSNYEPNQYPLNKNRMDNFGESSDIRNERNFGIGAHVKEDVFSRFRQRKSVGYSEWMKERTEKRAVIKEDSLDNY